MKLAIKALAAGAAVCASTVALAPAALAVGDPSDCRSGYVCLWIDIHYLSSGNRFTHLDTYYYRSTLPSSYNAKASSAYNHGTGGQAVYFYKSQRCPTGGARFRMSASDGDSNFANGSPAGNFQDAVRSLAFDSASLISQCQAG